MYLALGTKKLITNGAAEVCVWSFWLARFDSVVVFVLVA